MQSYVKKFILIFLITLIVGFLILGAVFLSAVFGMWGDVDDIDLDALTVNINSTIVYNDPNTGEEKLLYTLKQETNSKWVNLDQTPENLQNAFVAIEDERFPIHNGVDIKRTAKATLTYIGNKIVGKTGSASLGGSTITQQLIKNLTGEDDQTPARKITEISRAIDLEKKISKDEILELYLNCIYLSQGCNGVQAAANVYFEKDVSQLTLAQCASVAAITQNPGLYDPFVNPDANKERQETVLFKMLELDYITQEEYDKAIAEDIQLADPSERVNEDTGITSYYVDQIVRDLMDDLQEIGYSQSLAAKMVYSGGLKIVSAYDPNVQKIIDDYYKDVDNFPDSAAQSAMVIMEPTTGRVVGMAGGIGEKTGSLTLNRATQTPRQPGSTIKPIAVYAPAMDYGHITAASTYMDKAQNYNGWIPRNYSYTYSNTEQGVRPALRQSLNTVPVEVLNNDLGIDTSFAFLRDNMGISTLVDSDVQADGTVITDRALSPLALGGLTRGATVLEMTAAYCTFANNGTYNKPYTYTAVYDSEGQPINLNIHNSWQAMTDSTAYIMSQLMQEVVQSGTGRGAQIGSFFTAGKTGTTSENFDRWFIGYTPYYVSAVWYGYDIPESISIGSNPCIPVFQNIMTKIHKGLDSGKEFSRPNNITRASYCEESGMKPTSACPTQTYYFVSGTEPSKYCNHRHYSRAADDNEDNSSNNQISATSAPSSGGNEGNEDDNTSSSTGGSSSSGGSSSGVTSGSSGTSSGSNSSGSGSSGGSSAGGTVDTGEEE